MNKTVKLFLIVMALVMFVFTFTAFAQTETSADSKTETEDVDWEAFLTGLFDEISNALEDVNDKTILPVIEFNEKEQKCMAYLSSELESSADHLMRNGEDVDDIYTTLTWNSIADTFPAKFDLRDRGKVTPVRNQNPFGTCWSFATIAASETSILSSLGLTAEDYKEKYGEELDLSEKHLAWFTANALPESDAYPEGEYPFDEAQAGEGLHISDGSDVNPFNFGGNYALSTASLASGVGILKEKYAPYTNSEGLKEEEGDWSLPEEQRFHISYELKDANLLPAPAKYDEAGNYIYRPEGTEAIKTELMAGRAVGISFYADHSMPEPSKKQVRADIEEEFAEMENGTAEEKARLADILVGDVNAADLSDEELKAQILLFLRLYDLDEDTYDFDSLGHDDLVKIMNTKYIGNPYESILEYEKNRKVFMSFIGEDTVIYAQYTDEVLQINHGVTIVGWDDTFSAENWPEDHRPPADGVWIVKNSWGTNWGTNGYFLLSYYDKTLCSIGTFEYVVDEALEKLDYMMILQHDYMPSEITSSTLFDTPVYAANIFEVEEDSVLQFVSAMTGDLNTTVTASIYLLDDGAVVPTDGRLLDSITETFTFAGYHRMDLNSNLLLPKGSRVSVVIFERVPGDDGVKYALVNNTSISEDGAEAYNEIHAEEGSSVERYAKGVINRGESFISFEAERWIDWANAVGVIGKNGANVYMAYDNLPIKAYVYPWSQVEKVHDLSNRIRTAGGEAAICPEDGYMLLDVAK